MSEFLIPILHQRPEAPASYDSMAEDAVLHDTVVPAAALAASVSAGVAAESVQAETSERLLTEIEALKTLAYEKAYAEGFAQGKEDGRKQATEHVQQSLVALQEAEAAFKAQSQQYLARMDKVVAAIVFEAVLKIVGKELRHTGDRAQIIQQVLAQYEGHPIVQILVNPLDIKTIRQALQHSGEEQAIGTTLLAPDNKVALGGCRLVFKDAIVNTDIHQQLQAFATHLSEHVQVE